MRITHKDIESIFNKLLQRDCAATIHAKNWQKLTTKMYKTKNELNRSFMTETFQEKATCYILRNNKEFIPARVRSVNNGSESARFKGPQLWQTLLSAMRNSESFHQLKAKIKNWY